MSETTDIFIIGGGINGAGIARDAAGRGQKVALVEQTDLGGATSSASSKLIHGGLRYLENYEFRLVRESLLERETLWKIAPHLITPLRFILPHHKGLRPAFILRLGLFLYDYIGGRKLLPPTKRLNLLKDNIGTCLRDDLTIGFEYSDCWVDDARLVVLNALSAAEMGAKILTRHTFLGAVQKNGLWNIDVKTPDGSIKNYTAKVLINASGPWVDKSLNACNIGQKNTPTVRLIKGSHIIVPKLHDDNRALTFQHADGRVVFAIPYQKKYTLIGTTDTPFEADPRNVKADSDEIKYLCEIASEYFKKTIIPSDVVWTYSGVRPLYDDGAKNASKATRDYVLDLIGEQSKAPLLNIYGGKVTTYRCLAEEALEKVSPYIDLEKDSWTADTALPGGDLPGRQDPAKALNSYIEKIVEDYPWLDQATCIRMACAYGTRLEKMMIGVSSLNDMGQHFGAGLYAKEINYLINEEWAKTAEDILWRRTKLGLHMSEQERETVAAHIQQQSQT
ncbi:glycerol-3-phosphate dehydrogenase [Kordiimonas aquimaris]|uniref:glycerol-3-phosphate dehydrogenase n=1 Tax=Kordiimonas aquimaris TaxID=707591 RepID=UPI0021D38F03|nr:glycerol-3-phosphate dehydrogenase [Kordiimonas aquimaris]